LLQPLVYARLGKSERHSGVLPGVDHGGSVAPTIFSALFLKNLFASCISDPAYRTATRRPVPIPVPRNAVGVGAKKELIVGVLRDLFACKKERRRCFTNAIMGGSIGYAKSSPRDAQ
jgi:hypothetical protein